LILLGVAGVAIGSAATFLSIKILTPSVAIKNPSMIPMSYQGNIIKATQENTDFRRVLFTGLNSQLVVMSIPPGGEVGAETHKYTEQTLFFLSGTGEGELNSKKFPIVPGDVVVVVPGTEHNFWNTGAEPLKIYTVYAPPNHLAGLIEATKADADANTADEAIGETPPLK
jgi:mannose-6-phosphate isomerase-like protein (cupin superfamily)